MRIEIPSGDVIATRKIVFVRSPRQNRIKSLFASFASSKNDKLLILICACKKKKRTIETKPAGSVVICHVNLESSSNHLCITFLTRDFADIGVNLL